jgi:hypothetical protein
MIMIPNHCDLGKGDRLEIAWYAYCWLSRSVIRLTDATMCAACTGNHSCRKKACLVYIIQNLCCFVSIYLLIFPLIPTVLSFNFLGSFFTLILVIGQEFGNSIVSQEKYVRSLLWDLGVSSPIVDFNGCGVSRYCLLWDCNSWYKPS